MAADPEHRPSQPVDAHTSEGIRDALLSASRLTSGLTFQTYAVLLTFADRHGRCWPSTKTIMRGLPSGTDERGMRRARQNLVDLGLLEATERFDPSGRQTSSQYVLLSGGRVRGPGGEGQGTPLGVGQTTPLGEGQGTPPRTNHKEQTNQQTKGRGSSQLEALEVEGRPIPPSENVDRIREVRRTLDQPPLNTSGGQVP